MRKFHENEVTFLLRKIIDIEIRLQINVLVKKNLGKWLVTSWHVFIRSKYKLNPNYFWSFVDYLIFEKSWSCDKSWFITVVQRSGKKKFATATSPGMAELPVHSVLSLVFLPCQLMKCQLIGQKLVRKLLFLVCCFSQ